jgi:hypothetical protein
MTSVNFILVLQGYLLFTFALSIVLRYKQYRAIVLIIAAVPQRWPRLFGLMRDHRTVFLTWPTLLPVGLTLLLLLLHSIAYQWVWPRATVTPAVLIDHWLALVLLALCTAFMLYFDYDALFSVWVFDREAAEKQLDQAEYWLRSPLSPAIKWLTLGYINPRRMVGDEVRKALTDASVSMKSMMWRWSVQTGARLAVELILWLTWVAS